MRISILNLLVAVLGNAASLGCANPVTNVPPVTNIAAPVQQRSVAANGVSIAYLERAGTGSPVVLLHGFPDNAHTWDAVSASLNQRGHRTIAPFLRGYAPSTVGSADTTMIDLGRDVVALLDSLNIERATLIGHDWGATAAYAAANLAPNRVLGLVTIAIPHPLVVASHPEILAGAPHFRTFAQPDAAMRFRENDFAELRSTIQLWSPQWSMPASEIAGIKSMLSMPGVLDATLGYYRAQATVAPDLILFQKTTVPSLTLYGTHDGAVGSAAFTDQQIGFTTPVRTVALDAGHFVHREREEEATLEILQFLARP